MQTREGKTQWVFGVGCGLLFAGVAYGAARYFPDDRQDLFRKVVHLLILLAGAACLLVGKLRSKSTS